jgi:hypothetical protein
MNRFDAHRVVSSITFSHIALVLADTFKCALATVLFVVAMVVSPTIMDFTTAEYHQYQELRTIMQLQYPRMTDELFEIIYTEGRTHGIHVRLIASVINEESRWVQSARSGSGAIGYMQVMPIHFSGELSRLYTPRANISWGTGLLRIYLKMAQGNLVLALKHYNSGPASGFFNGHYIARVMGNIDISNYIAYR